MGRNFAITIGINEYDNLQCLNYAKRDAETMRDYFLQEAKFEQVYHFAADAPDILQDRGAPLKALPMFAKLERFLDVRFDQPFLQAGDNFWFFFAGHGIRHRERDYLMPSDVNPRNVLGTAIAVNHIAERLRGCGADNVILILDACRNDDRAGEGIGNEHQKGVVTLFACSPGERSQEIDELQHGAFTAVLLDGLRIQGSGNCATVERLDQHLRIQVPDLNRRYHKPRQTPYTTAEPNAKRHLILLPTFDLADVMVLKNDALEAEADRDWELAEHLWTRVLAVSLADAQAIRAIKRIARMDIENHPRQPDKSLLSVSSRGIVEPQGLQRLQFEVITVDHQGKEQRRDRKRAEYFTEDLGKEVTLEMVAISGGTFQMGSDEHDSEKPIHTVKLEPFFMGKYPVTQKQWLAVMGEFKQEPGFSGENRPIERVSWDDAIAFCTRLSQKTGKLYRLPSEAEWEYACRAETTTPFHFGETITPDLANYDGNYTYGEAPKGTYREQTSDVGSFPANAFGLSDMHGNVWEWCADPSHKNYHGAPTDGRVWDENTNNNRYQNHINLLIKSKNDRRTRLLRGGAWLNYPDYCRAACRNDYSPDTRNFIIGFRVVL